MNATFQESSTTKEEPVENKEEYPGEFTENKKVVQFVGEYPTTELQLRRLCYQ